MMFRRDEIEWNNSFAAVILQTKEQFCLANKQMNTNAHWIFKNQIKKIESNWGILKIEDDISGTTSKN